MSQAIGIYLLYLLRSRVDLGQEIYETGESPTCICINEDIQTAVVDGVRSPVASGEQPRRFHRLQVHPSNSPTTRPMLHSIVRKVSRTTAGWRSLDQKTSNVGHSSQKNQRCPFKSYRSRRMSSLLVKIQGTRPTTAVVVVNIMESTGYSRHHDTIPEQRYYLLVECRARDFNSLDTWWYIAAAAVKKNVERSGTCLSEDVCVWFNQ